MAIYKGTAYTRTTNGTGFHYFAARLGAVDETTTNFEDGPNWDLAAGLTPLVFKVNRQVTGLTPPGTPTSLTVELRHAGTSTVAAATTVDVTGSGPYDVSVTPAANGVLLVGDFRVFLRAVRSGAGGYDVNSEDGGNGSHQGFIRISPTSMAVTVSHSGPADPAAYGDVIQAVVDLSNGPNLDLAHRHFDVRAKSATSATIYATVRTTGTDPQVAQFAVNNTFPRNVEHSVEVEVEVVAVPSANAPTSDPTVTWIAVPVGTADRVSATLVRKPPIPVESTLRMDHHLQVNSNVFDAAKDQESRLTSDLGMVTTTISNARGEPISGITYRSVLQDQDELVDPAFDRTVTTDASGRPPDMVPWSSALPGGAWLHTTTITAPPQAVGLEDVASSARTLIASNPALSMIVGAGPAGAANEGRHVEAGMVVLVGLTVMDVFAKKQVSPDAGTAKAALCRFNLTFARAEFLADDLTWQPITGAPSIHFWTLVPSPGDPNTHIRSFTDTTDWGASDLFVVAEASVKGVPLTSYSKEPVVGAVNGHGGYKFDGPGFIGFPTR